LLDPTSVVERFTTRVLGWPTDTYSADLEQIEGGQVLVHVSRVATACPTPVEDDFGALCYGGTEEIRLIQPVKEGDGGIWTVASVMTPTMTLEAQPGETVTNGGTVGVRSTVPSEIRAVVGTSIGDWNSEANCAATSGLDRLERPDQRIAVKIGSDQRLGTSCGDVVPGYVWAASATWRLGPGANPLVGDSTQYVALTAVPIVVTIPENAEPSGFDTFTDALGWRVEHPSDWIVTPLDEEPGKVTVRGASFSNLPIDAASGVSASPAPLPPDGVEVTISHLFGGPPPDVTSDDTAFPISPDDLRCRGGPGETDCDLGVRGNGLDYQVQLREGGEASSEAVDAAKSIISSLRFQALRDGDDSHGWVAIGELNTSRQGRGTPWFTQGRIGVFYVMQGPGGIYALDLQPDGCGEGENETWDPKSLQILIECPYPGDHDARFDRFGSPDPGNDPDFSQPLHAYSIVTAWNGTLLLYEATRMDQLPLQYWP
jgi:hypothetical protein